MNVAEVLRALQTEAENRIYIRHLEVLELTPTLIKARLSITSELFIQIYRNERFDTTNFVLIYNQRRIYARDQITSNWHRHPAANPQSHDFSTEGQRAVDLQEFLDEVETVMALLELP